MPIYVGKDELNIAKNIWFEGFSIKLRKFRWIT